MSVCRWIDGSFGGSVGRSVGRWVVRWVGGSFGGSVGGSVGRSSLHLPECRVLSGTVELISKAERYSVYSDFDLL